MSTPDPIGTIRTLVDDVNAARAELAKALGPSERSLAEGVAKLATQRDALRDDVFRIYAEHRAEVERLKRELAEATKKVESAEAESDSCRLIAEGTFGWETLEIGWRSCDAVRDLRERYRKANKQIEALEESDEKLRAELDAIKAPRCLSEQEAVDTWDTTRGFREACHAVARAAERKLVGALLGVGNEESCQTVRSLLKVIGYLGVENLRLADPAAEPAQPEPAFNLAEYIAAQREWSKRTFGNTTRTKGILAHIRKELAEIEAKPFDVEEWIDVVILALDGAWRHGGQPETILATMKQKQAKNFARQWLPLETQCEDEPSEHVEPTKPASAVLSEIALGRAYHDAHDGSHISGLRAVANAAVAAYRARLTSDGAVEAAAHGLVRASSERIPWANLFDPSRDECRAEACGAIAAAIAHADGAGETVAEAVKVEPKPKFALPARHEDGTDAGDRAYLYRCLTAIVHAINDLRGVKP